MNEHAMVRARRQSDGTLVQILEDGTTRPLEDRTDWARVDAMTEEEVEANAASDPDNPPLTAEELARMQRVPNPKEIRQRLHLSQEQFAVRFQVPLGTLRDWEQGRSAPDTTAKTLLRVIDKNPEAVIQALER
jgi:putative transcriptional regulator